ncbi:MAG: hypothetical protein DCF32_20165 [Leptolyngbya sp.]|nr:MAG: hypothetical protein DCF32_20165 [Leptolyngbya sp.]
MVKCPSALAVGSLCHFWSQYLSLYLILFIHLTGLLGVLVAAKQSGLITELKPLLDALISQVKFRVHPDLYRQILRDVGEA